MDNTLEEILDIIEAANQAGEPYAFIKFEGRDAVIRLSSIGRRWLESATMTEIKRLTVF